jgi:hypothetical protein
MNGETETPEFKQAEEVKVNANVGVVYTLADSGQREVFESGAVRDVRTGKGRFDLITPIGLRRLAAVYERGAGKYAPRNWEAGIPVSRCLDSALRHVVQYLAGENTEDHLAQAAWNLFAAMHFEEVRPELVDIPTRAGS